MKTLSGAKAVVTGASGGVGRALALALAAEGVDLILAGRSAQRLATVVRAAADSGTRVHAVAGDLTLERDVAELAQRVQREFGRLDLLIHALGSFARGSIHESGEEILDHQYQVNTRAPYAVTRMLLGLLREAAGDLVFLNSSAGLSARAGVAPYAASKYALRALADALREEVNPAGVRVLSVFLGRTATPMQKRVRELEGLPYEPQRLLQPEDVAAMVVAALRLPRTAEVTELHLRPLQKI